MEKIVLNSTDDGSTKNSTQDRPSVQVYILGIVGNNSIEELHGILSSHFNCQRMCLLSSSISKPLSLRLSIQYPTMNSKVGKLKKHNAWDE